MNRLKEIEGYNRDYFISCEGEVISFKGNKKNDIKEKNKQRWILLRKSM